MGFHFKRQKGSRVAVRKPIAIMERVEQEMKVIMADHPRHKELRNKDHPQKANKEKDVGGKAEQRLRNRDFLSYLGGVDGQKLT